MERQTENIKLILSKDFEKELFEASLHTLKDNDSKLRFNNFAYSIRELSRHFLHRLAPDKNVQTCCWYKKETENGLPTRAQRIKYAIQGGIPDDIIDNLGIDTNGFQQSVKAIKQSIDLLSRYTHINADVFNMKNEEVEQKSIEILSDFELFVESIKACRIQLIKLLEGKLEEEAVNSVIFSSFENIDSLAPHYSLDEVYVDMYSVIEINEDEIVVEVQGEIGVTLQWGSNSERSNGDGHDIEESFPFGTKIRYLIGEDFPEDNPEVDEPWVDTSKWEIHPEDELQ